MTTTPAVADRAGPARPPASRPSVAADTAARERRHAARIRDLTALLRQRPDLAGVYLPADFSVEAIHWSA